MIHRLRAIPQVLIMFSKKYKTNSTIHIDSQKISNCQDDPESNEQRWKYPITLFKNLVQSCSSQIVYNIGIKMHMMTSDSEKIVKIKACMAICTSTMVQV